MKNVKAMKEHKKDLERYKKSKSNFIEKVGKYSASIVLNGVKTFYSDKRINPAVFGYGKLLKNELEPYIEDFKNKKDLGYFILNAKRVNADRIFNIDISAAYLTALYNTGKISEKLYKKINSLSKPDRLVCLGLLAYEPIIRIYKEGKLHDIQKEKNEYREIFFFLIKEVFEISKQIRKKLGKDFIFSWVDGFYFKGEKNIHIVQDYLRGKKFKFKTFRLFNFKSENRENFVTFNYAKKEHKDGKEFLRNVSIVVPKNSNVKDLSDFFAINEQLDRGDYSGLLKMKNAKLNQNGKRSNRHYKGNQRHENLYQR